jgi:hypothetical protein
MHNIRGRIIARALLNNRSRAEAAAEVAEEDRLNRRVRAASVPVSPHRGDDPRRSLIDKVTAMAHRLCSQPVAPPSQAQPSPQPPVRRRLVKRITDALTPEEPKPSPPTPRPPLVVAEGSRAQLIEDLPHNGGGDYVTGAWRASVERNAKAMNEGLRGTPPKSTYIG